MAATSIRPERRLAVGRMTEVWLGTAADGRPFAIKTLKSDWLAKPGARTLLRREYELLESLQHPHIVTADALVDTPDCAALVCEYLGGGDLVSLAGAPARHWIDSVRDVLAALEYLHGRGFVHRDIKARNVMFDGEGRARLIDFGSAARVGAPWTQHGTTAAHRPARPPPGRVAAEQDLHAFAVLLYELLAGRLPSPTGSDAGAEHAAEVTSGAEAEPGAGAAPDAGAWAHAPRLASAGEDSPELAALGRLVLGTLASGGGSGIGSVPQFANVIESVLASQSTPP